MPSLGGPLQRCAPLLSPSGHELLLAGRDALLALDAATLRVKWACPFPARRVIRMGFVPYSDSHVVLLSRHRVCVLDVSLRQVRCEVAIDPGAPGGWRFADFVPCGGPRGILLLATRPEDPSRDVPAEIAESAGAAGSPAQPRAGSDARFAPMGPRDVYAVHRLLLDHGQSRLSGLGGEDCLCTGAIDSGEHQAMHLSGDILYLFSGRAILSGRLPAGLGAPGPAHRGLRVFHTATFAPAEITASAAFFTPAGCGFVFGDRAGMVYRVGRPPYPGRLHNSSPSRVHWHSGPVRALSVSFLTASVQKIVSGGQEGVLVVWDGQSPTVSTMPRFGAAIAHLCLASPFVNSAATAGSSTFASPRSQQSVFGSRCAVVTESNALFLADLRDMRLCASRTGLLMGSALPHLDIDDSAGVLTLPLPSRRDSEAGVVLGGLPGEFQVVRGADRGNAILPRKASIVHAVFPRNRVHDLRISSGSTRLSSLFPSPDGEFLYSVGSQCTKGAEQTLCVTRLGPDRAATICREARPHQTGVRFLAAPTSFDAVDAGMAHVFATAGETNVRLFSVENAASVADVEEAYGVRELTSLEMPGRVIISGAFSPDGTLLFVLARESDAYGAGTGPGGDICTLAAFAVSLEDGLRPARTATFSLQGAGWRTQMAVGRSFLVVATHTDLYHMRLDSFGPGGMERLVVRAEGGALGCAPRALGPHPDAHGCLAAAVSVRAPAGLPRDLLVRVSASGLCDVVRNPHGERLKSLDCYGGSERVYALYLDRESRQVVSLCPCSEALEALPRAPPTQQEAEADEGGAEGGRAGGGSPAAQAYLARATEASGTVASLRSVGTQGDPFAGAPSHDLAPGFDALESMLETILGGAEEAREVREVGEAGGAASGIASVVQA